MSRDLCIEFPNAFYHICSRGINRQDLYLDNSDFEKFLSICRRAKRKFNLRIFAYCLMNNHYHLYLSTPDANIAKSIKFINETYARHFLEKYPEKDGHVFRGRYKRKLVQDDLYSLTLLSYIHHNPKKAGLVSNLEDWKYSSYASYVGKMKSLDFIDYNWSLDQFGSGENKLKNFIKYHNEEFDTKWNPDEQSKAGIFISDDDFIINICERYLDLSSRNPSIRGHKELIKICNKVKLIQNIRLLNISDKNKTRLMIYLLKEYSALSLKEIGEEVSKSPATVSKSYTRTKIQIKDDLHMRNMVFQLIEMSNV